MVFRKLGSFCIKRSFLVDFGNLGEIGGLGEDKREKGQVKRGKYVGTARGGRIRELTGLMGAWDIMFILSSIVAPLRI